jgi:mycothiol S-conjugate amidase
MLDPASAPAHPSGSDLCLMQVHAHPDDEASKGSGTNARYSAEGVHTVLVCCTGGEAGDILNPAMDNPAIRARLPEIRLGELEASAAALGYDAVHLLGYRDSGMADSDENSHPDAFANAPLQEAVERLVGLIRMERPQILVAYRDERAFYPHPDHYRVHEISVAAFDAAGDPERFPQAGPPWQPLKLYYLGWSKARVQALHDAFLARGEESPYAQWFERGFGSRPDDYTTLIDVGDFLHKRREALLAHRTQVDPEGFWMRLPDDVIREVFPWEEFHLARSLVDTGVADGEIESDLFAGVREQAVESRR